MPTKKASRFEAVALRRIRDDRGTLLIAEQGREFPFTPVRFFTISDVPPGERRAEHAHHTLEEFFICLDGACTVTLDDGKTRTDVRLDRPEQGVHKAPMVWVALHSFTPDAKLLVVASDTWRHEDHITDYDEFLRLARESSR